MTIGFQEPAAGVEGRGHPRDRHRGRRTGPPRTPRPLVGSTAVVLGIVLLAAAPAAAQEPGSPDAAPALAADELRVAAFAGALTPMARLTQQEEGFGTELAVSGVFGADAVYWARPRFGVGVQAAFAPATLMVLPGQFTGALPEDLGEANYFAVGADVRYRLPPPSRLVSLEPWVAAGVGLRVLDLQPIAEPEAEDAVDPVASVAVGTDLPVIHRFSLRFELRDRLSVYRAPDGGRRTQNDLSVIVGVSTRVR